MDKILDILSFNTKLTIAQLHHQRFQNILDNGGQHIRVEECEYYKNVWGNAVTSLILNQPLSEEAKSEFYDYITSGEEGLLLPEEIKEVRKLYDE